MRTLFGLVATCALFAVAAAQNIDDPVLQGARAGVGAAGLSSLRSVQLTGHTRNLIGSSGQASAERPVEIRISLPDKYLHVVKRTNVELRSGFNGDILLNSARALAPDTTYGSSAYSSEQIGIERARFARLMLGMFAYSGNIVRLSTKTLNATTIAVTGIDEGTTFLELDAATGAPARIRHQGDVRFPAPGSPTPTDRERTEIVWTFADRRSVSGINVPHRIVRTARQYVLEEIQFTSVVINPDFSEKDFAK